MAVARPAFGGDLSAGLNRRACLGEAQRGGGREGEKGQGMEGHIVQEPPPPSTRAGSPPVPTSRAAARWAGSRGQWCKGSPPGGHQLGGPRGRGPDPCRRRTSAGGPALQAALRPPPQSPPARPHADAPAALSSSSPRSQGTEPERRGDREPSCAGGRRRGPGRQTRGSGGARAGAAGGRGAGWRRGRCARWPRPGPAPASLTRPGRGGSSADSSARRRLGPVVGQPGRCQV